MKKIIYDKDVLNYKKFLCKKYLCKYSSLEKVEEALTKKGFKKEDVYSYIKNRVEKYNDFRDIVFL